MVIPWINMGEKPLWLKIDKVIEGYSRPDSRCRFVGNLCIADSSRRNQTERPVAVFWQENPAKPEYSNYFGIFSQEGQAMITNAISVAEGVWNGAMDPETGEVIFSRFRHDYRRTRSDRVMVDGGRDYFKSSGGTPVRLKLIDGFMRIV